MLFPTIYLKSCLYLKISFLPNKILPPHLKSEVAAHALCTCFTNCQAQRCAEILSVHVHFFLVQIFLFEDSRGLHNSDKRQISSLITWDSSK